MQYDDRQEYQRAEKDVQFDSDDVEVSVWEFRFTPAKYVLP